MGNAYQEKSSIKNKLSNLNEAIKAHKIASELFYNLRQYNYFVSAQNNIGCDYLALSEISSSNDYILQAIESFNVATTLSNIDPVLLSKIKLNMGIAYKELANINASSKCLDNTLESCILSKDLNKNNPLMQARISVVLGDIYSKLAEADNHIKNIKLSLNAYNEATTIYTKTEYPLKYAYIMRQLGDIYCDYLDYQNSKQIAQKSYECYRESILTCNCEEDVSVSLII